jgi:hypothetical protein
MLPTTYIRRRYNVIISLSKIEREREREREREMNE